MGLRERADKAFRIREAENRVYEENQRYIARQQVTRRLRDWVESGFGVESDTYTVCWNGFLNVPETQIDGLTFSIADNGCVLVDYCKSCGTRLTHEVSSLEYLGKLLAEKWDCHVCARSEVNT